MCKCGANLCVWLGKRLSQIPAFFIAWEGLVVCFLSPFCTFLLYLLTPSVRQTTLGKVLRALGLISWDFGYSNDILLCLDMERGNIQHSFQCKFDTSA